MLKKENGVLASGNNWARVCDTCRSAACTVYCRADSAYLCTGCDARIHAANRVASRHERVWVCEACEHAPAAFICKADAASLCATCDADIHSANPLARRHHRVPILPIPGCLYGPPATDPGGSVVEPSADADDEFLAPENDETIEKEDEDEAASWLLLNPVKPNPNQHNNGFLFGGEVVDEYLDQFRMERPSVSSSSSGSSSRPIAISSGWSTRPQKLDMVTLLGVKERCPARWKGVIKELTVKPSHWVEGSATPLCFRNGILA